MTESLLKPSETKLLLAAAAADGRIIFSERMKETSRQRLAGLLTRLALVEANADGALRLTRAGYRAIGLEPPRRKRPAGEVPPRPKREVMLELLGRPEGASLDELMTATGWLPHTTRGALSRIRTGGQMLAKARREDGVTSYRLLADEEISLPQLRRTRVDDTRVSPASSEVAA